MKKAFLFVLLGLMISSCNQKTTQPPAVTDAQATARDGVFIHITECYDDPHRVLMPLKMAAMMAADKDVLVYMDIHSVHLLVKDAKDIEFADFESAHTLIKKLLAMNVGVYACPTCLKIAGYEPGDLMEGIQVAQKERFFDFTKGRIITLDY
ncbi:MAG: DsrE family protein [Bacteroidales bacterium]|nr:DsrE family protein [Bacteroidales bacterium]